MDIAWILIPLDRFSLLQIAYKIFIKLYRLLSEKFKKQKIVEPVGRTKT